MHTIALSNRIIKGINFPVVTADGLDIDAIEIREQLIIEQIAKLNDQLMEYAEMKDAIDDEAQRLINNNGFESWVRLKDFYIDHKWWKRI